MNSAMHPPKDVLAETKATAAGHRTAVKALFEHALRKGIGLESLKKTPRTSTRLEQKGSPSRGKHDKVVVSSKLIYEMMDKLGI